MRNVPFGMLAPALLLILSLHPAPGAQSGRQAPVKKPEPAAAPAQLLKRTTARREVKRLGYGGSVTVYGAPEGSVRIEAWTRGEVEITAEVELTGATEAELTQLAAVNTFVVDDDLNHVRVMTVGTHDPKYLKRVARDLPRRLREMPWKIDYHIRVPAAVDLEVFAGRGRLSLAGVEGAVRVNGGDGPAELTFTGGDVQATLLKGPVTVRVPSRSWRGRGIGVKLASGDMTVELTPGFSGDVDAEVLRAGRVENSHPGLAPRERTTATERSLRGRAGQGGATLSFTVGDGTLRIVQATGGQ
ncbi:MAG TPA: hypothetical protein VK422_22200 [Pyrinomonadaceae bacterium]|nr:hypothetical protein [Pyrinomonadaceae bacterium]